ncbi:MAG: tetratricopeptide repeat protein [Planctomycetes bacterium]|nr:tetratricopeptide repeat protein [Planctomycetota bacterium]
MTDNDPTPPTGLPPLPAVMFLPLAAPDTDWGELDPGVLSRRIPDFVHQVLNQGQVGPTGMLEVQSPPDEGPVTWVLMDSPPDADEAFDLMPDDQNVRAVVTGEVAPAPDGLRIEFHVYFAEDAADSFTNKVGGVVTLQDPVAGLMQVTRRLARVLELPFHEPPRGLLTRNGPAFLCFLQGLDNAMLLSGDLQIQTPPDRLGLLRPFVEALELDRSFGLALRVAHSTMAVALEDERIDLADVHRFLDRCFSSQPFDGEGCVAVAEQLRDLGDEQRAIAWLQHAVRLESPPPRSLENLGIIYANRGDTDQARTLWRRGIELDGHPGFFAHLARLAFADERPMDAWDLGVRGLRRLHERAARAGEWEDHESGAGMLLRYLWEHLGERKAPGDVVDALVDLATLLDGEDQVYLGLCMLSGGRRPEARAELVAGLQSRDLDSETRDLAIRALLNLDVTDFEKRFGKAADVALQGRNPRTCLPDFHRWLELQPDFWPALFFSAVAKRRLGQADEALDLLAAASERAPGQPDIKHQMALLFDERGNPKRALELVDEALLERDDDERLYASKVEFLLRLGRREEARAVLDLAEAVVSERRELTRLRRRLDD